MKYDAQYDPWRRQYVVSGELPEIEIAGALNKSELLKHFNIAEAIVNRVMATLGPALDYALHEALNAIHNPEAAGQRRPTCERSDALDRV